MKTKEAFEVLIHCAARELRGAGCGLREIPSEKERSRIKEAIKKIFPKAFNRPMCSSDEFNMF